MTTVLMLFALFFPVSALSESRECLSLFTTLDLGHDSNLKPYVQTLIDGDILTVRDLQVFLESGSFLLNSSELHVHVELLRTLETLNHMQEGARIRNWLVSILKDNEGEVRNKSVIEANTASAHKALKMVRFYDKTSKRFVEISNIHVTLGLYSEVMGWPLDRFEMVKADRSVDPEALLARPVYGLTYKNMFDFLNKYSKKHGLLHYFLKSTWDERYFSPKYGDPSLFGYRLPIKAEIDHLLLWDIHKDPNRLEFDQYAENAHGVVQPVASLWPIVVERQEIFDLGGNVRNALLMEISSPGSVLKYGATVWTGKSGSWFEFDSSLNEASLAAPCGFRLARTIGDVDAADQVIP